MLAGLDVRLQADHLSSLTVATEFVSNRVTVHFESIKLLSCLYSTRLIALRRDFQ